MDELLLTAGLVLYYRTYAAVAADTYSSELGILSKSAPRLITSPTFRKVPPGTNGGITLVGVAAGSLGAFTIAVTSLLLPFCSLGSPVAGCSKLGLDGGSAWGWNEQALWVLAITVWGTLGSLLDSLLGGLLQATVVDKQTGKVVEGCGGQKVSRTPRCLPPIALPLTSLTRFLSTLVPSHPKLWEILLSGNKHPFERTRILLMPCHRTLLLSRTTRELQIRLMRAVRSPPAVTFSTTMLSIS